MPRAKTPVGNFRQAAVALNRILPTAYRHHCGGKEVARIGVLLRLRGPARYKRQRAKSCKQGSSLRLGAVHPTPALNYTAIQSRWRQEAFRPRLMCHALLDPQRGGIR